MNRDLTLGDNPNHFARTVKGSPAIYQRTLSADLMKGMQMAHKDYSSMGVHYDHKRSLEHGHSSAGGAKREAAEDSKASLTRSNRPPPHVPAPVAPPMKKKRRSELGINPPTTQKYEKKFEKFKLPDLPKKSKGVPRK